MSTFYTQGIILKKTDRGEADQLFSIYTYARGKVVALGRATKKIQSKLNPSLQQYAILNLMIAPGKRYDHIAAVKLDRNFSSLKNNFKKIVLGAFALELVEKFTKPDSPDPKIFLLLQKYFIALNDHDFKDSDWLVIKQAFALKLLTLLGFKPEEVIASDAKKFDQFLQHQLDDKLQTEEFILKLFPSA